MLLFLVITIKYTNLTDIFEITLDKHYNPGYGYFLSQIEIKN